MKGCKLLLRGILPSELLLGGAPQFFALKASGGIAIAPPLCGGNPLGLLWGRGPPLQGVIPAELRGYGIFFLKIATPGWGYPRSTLGGTPADFVCKIGYFRINLTKFSRILRKLMPRTAENCKKIGFSSDKISSEWPAAPQKFILPPFGSSPPFVKNFAIQEGLHGGGCPPLSTPGVPPGLLQARIW